MVCGFLGLGLSMVGVSSTSTSGIDEMETWPGYQDWVLAIIIALVGIAQMYLVIWALQVFNSCSSLVLLSSIFCLVGVTSAVFYGEATEYHPSVLCPGTQLNLVMPILL